MNPCTNMKRRIVWMASGILDPNEAEAVRAHLHRCSGCRSYWRSMSELTQQLAVASEFPEAEPSERMHRRVMARITERSNRSRIFEWAAAFWRLSGGRTAIVAVGAVFCIAVLLLVQTFRHGERRLETGMEIRTKPDSAIPTFRPATLGSYRRAVGISFESLDNLLAAEAARTSAEGLTLTVSRSLALSLE